MTSKPTSKDNNQLTINPDAAPSGVVETTLAPAASGELDTTAIAAPTVERRPLPFLPADADDMWRLATQLSKAHVVPDALRGQPADVFVVLMTGREMGLPPMQSLSSLHCIHGKVFTSAQLLAALVHKSGACEYLRCEHSDDKSARYRTRRKGWLSACQQCQTEYPNDRAGSKCVCDGIIVPRSQALTFTLDQAKAYGLFDKKGSAYKSKPAVMLRWRAAAQLARDVYPEVTLGMYDESELGDDGAPVEATVPADDELRAGVDGLKAQLAARS